MINGGFGLVLDGSEVCEPIVCMYMYIVTVHKQQ